MICGKILREKAFRFFWETRIVWIYASVVGALSVWDFFWRFPTVNGLSVAISLLFNGFVLLLAFRIHHRFCKILGTFGIFVTFCAFYVLDILQYRIDPQMMLIFLLQTSQREVSAFFSLSMGISFVLLFVFLFFLARIRPSPPKKSRRVLPWIFLALFAYFLYPCIRNVVNTNLHEKAIPYSLTIRKNRTLNAIFWRFLYPRVDYSSELSYRQRPVNIYLMIGESVRGDHLGINGYEKNTTPMLRKENVINFGINRSCGNLTYISWRYLFARSKCSQDFSKINQVAIPYYFKKESIPTLMVSQADEESLANVTKDVDTSQSSYAFDQNTYAAFKVMDKNLTRKLFILNSFGSHPPYIRPPAGLEIGKEFFPILDKPQKSYSIMQSGKNEELHNMYDNTVLFLDWQIGHIIEDLKKSKEPTLLLYTSDHGEMLNERGQHYGHGGKSIENYMVPLFAWANAAFQKTYFREYRNLVRNAKRYSNQLTHEVIWHSIMDIGGFRNKDPKHPVIDFKRSLFREELEPQLPKNWFHLSQKRS